MKAFSSRINVLIFIYTLSPSLQFLLLKRTPERSGYWQPVSGGVEANELRITTIQREGKEESGIIL